MKKKIIVLTVSAVLASCLLTSCALIPISWFTGTTELNVAVDTEIETETTEAETEEETTEV